MRTQLDTVSAEFTNSGCVTNALLNQRKINPSSALCYDFYPVADSDAYLVVRKGMKIPNELIPVRLW